MTGIFNLNRYKFCLKDERRKDVQQIYSQFQHIIIIEDKSEMSNAASAQQAQAIAV
jgi:hypothetical protein